MIASRKNVDNVRLSYEEYFKLKYIKLIYTVLRRLLLVLLSC